MGLTPIGEYLTTINVNGTQRVDTVQTGDETFNITESLGADIQVNGTTEGSFTQTSDSTYNVDVAADAGFDRIEVWTFAIADSNDFAGGEWDVFNGSGSKIDNVELKNPENGGPNLNVKQKVYTDEGEISVSENFTPDNADVLNHVITPNESVTIESVSQS